MHLGYKYYNNFFFKKKILITGNTGFKGSWLSFFLINLGAKVYGLSLKKFDNSLLFKELKLNKKIETFYQDVKEKNKFEKIVKKVKPNIIFHLAAQSLVFNSYVQPEETIYTNTIGVLNLLEILKKTKDNITAIIITSDKCYLPNKKGFFNEDDKLGGQDPYSASKASAEILINCYYNSYLKYKKNIKIVSARAGNVIGGGDWSKDRIVPDIIRSIFKKKYITLRNPLANRPWQHVFEPINAYLLLAMHLSKFKKINGEVFNIGPRNKNNKNVKDLTKLFVKLFNYKKKIKIKKNLFKETFLLNLNVNKIYKKIKWKIMLSFKETVFLTYEWYFTLKYKRNNLIKVSNKHFEFFLNKYFKNE
jgi:CDP-glucose 4,6-dehydratase